MTTEWARVLCGVWAGALLAGCSGGAELAEQSGSQHAALVTSCATDAECGAGFVCTTGNSCVRPSDCYSGASGPGVFAGSLVIDGTDTQADVAALNGAWCVTGDLSVKKTALTELTGLGSVIAVSSNISIEDNPSLLGLQGLSNLRRAGKLALFRNASITSLSGVSKLQTLMSLQLYINPKLADLSGLQGVTYISNAEVVNNAGLTSLNGLGSITSVYSYVDVRLNPLLTDVSGLGGIKSVGSLVQITDNANLQNLQGLDNLTTIGSTLRVLRNGKLTSLSALAKLTRTTTFQVSDNPTLDSCGVTDLATRVGADCSGCVRNGPCPPPDHCPDDPAKLEPGTCGCGVADVDTDTDGALDCVDPCPLDAPNDSDADGVCNSVDQCAGFDDRTDVDQNGIPDGCQPPPDNCPDDPEKLEPGSCGCGVAEVDSDADGIFDCQDRCAGSDDHVDTDQNGIPDGCQQCITAQGCDDGNSCTTDSCVAGFCANVPTQGASCGIEGKCSATGACVEPLCKFKLLGSLGDSNSSASAVSSDGRTIAGTTYPTFSSAQAFRWTAERGKVPLFTSYSLVATAISGDGLSIGGYTTGSSQRAFLEGSAGPILLAAQSAVSGISADGRFIVGQSGNRAYRWDQYFKFPKTLSIATFSFANDISANGSVIVGQVPAPYDRTGYEAFVFSAGAMTRLGDFRTNIRNLASKATAVSPDGRIVVGEAADDQSPSRPFRWTRETGLVKVEQSIVPVAVNDAGMILGTYSVVGSSIGDGDLRELLIACGADIATSSYLSARDMTPDGKTIVGSIGYGARYHAFKVELP